MTELNGFEQRFARALGRYMAEAPADVDAWAVAQVALGARQRAIVWPWELRPSRVLVWVAMLALLMALLVAGALYVGSRPPALMASCAAGTKPDLPGPADQVRPPWVYVQPMAFDSRAGRIVAHAIDTWTFDVCTNMWSAMHPAVEAPEAKNVVYDADSDLTLAIGDGWVRAYDLRANTWTRMGTTPAVGDFPRMAYDPVSGLVVVAAMDGVPIEMWTYDVDSDTWVHIDATGAPTSLRRPIMAYDPSVERIVVYDAELPATWLFDPRTGNWTASTARTPELGFDWAVTGQEMAFDEVSQQVVAFSGGKVVAYDARADRWQVLADARAAGTCADLTCIGRPAFVYDSFNKRLVAYGSEYAVDSGWGQPSAVLAFDPATTTWTTLLASVGTPSTSAP